MFGFVSLDLDTFGLAEAEREALYDEGLYAV